MIKKIKNIFKIAALSLTISQISSIKIGAMESNPPRSTINTINNINQNNTLTNEEKNKIKEKIEKLYKNQIDFQKAWFANMKDLYLPRVDKLKINKYEQREINTIKEGINQMKNKIDSNKEIAGYIHEAYQDLLLKIKNLFIIYNNVQDTNEIFCKEILKSLDIYKQGINDMIEALGDYNAIKGNREIKGIYTQLKEAEWLFEYTQRMNRNRGNDE